MTYVLLAPLVVLLWVACISATIHIIDETFGTDLKGKIQNILKDI